MGPDLNGRISDPHCSLAKERICKGPFINYVTHLGVGGGSHLCYDLLRRGGGCWQKCHVKLRCRYIVLYV